MVRPGETLTRAWHTLTRQSLRLRAGSAAPAAAAGSALPIHLAGALETPEAARLEREAAALGPWEQGPFPLGGGVSVGTPSWPPGRTTVLLDLLGSTLGDARALDVGSNAGFDAFLLRLHGAGDVVGCEPGPALRQAEWLESIYGTGAQFRQIGWQALRPDGLGRFDLVHCAGLLDHEPAPERLLYRLREMATDGGRLLLGTTVAPELNADARFVPGAIGRDHTWWWLPGEAALQAMLAVAGFEVLEQRFVAAGPAWEIRLQYRYVAARATGSDPALVAAQLPEEEVLTRSPLGHYYSPVPDPRELTTEPRRSQIWPPEPRQTVGIEWRDAEQLKLCLDVFARQERLIFADAASADPSEYFAENGQFPPLDAWILEGILRHLSPGRIIEVGSGFSSLVSARVNREYLNGAVDFTCIEPYPRQFLLDGVRGIASLRVEKVQDTPMEVFTALSAGDVLFIDTSHTVKTGGDVPWIFGEILPRLASGVHVHVHDVFLPGDYPEVWVRDGWGWNENYLVRAFLTFNAGFDVVLGTQYMLANHRETIGEAFPDFATCADSGGASLWLRRV